MSHEKEKSGEAFFPVPLEENSPHAGRDEFRPEEGDQNEDLLQVLMQFLESEQVLDLPCAETDTKSSELVQIPQEKESHEAESDGLLMLGDMVEQKDLFQEINQFLNLEEVFQVLSAEILNNEQDSTSGQPSGENKDLNMKENIDRGKEDIKEMEEGRKTSAPSKTGSNDIKKRDQRGKCCECNKVYLRIRDHSRRKHNGKLEKCITSGCKKYFASVQRRIEHEQEEHQERKEFQCQFCHYSTEQKANLKRHVLRKHSEKKIRCVHQKKCDKMFASEADLKNHVKKYHKMVKCPTCGREMSHYGLYDHNRYGRCPGIVSK